MKKKLISALLCMTVMATMLTGCSGKGETSDSGDIQNDVNDEEYVAQIPYYSSLCSAPFHIAIEKGYFDELGLKYNAFAEDNSDMDLVVSGKADVAYDLLPTIIQRIENGLDIKVVMGAHVGCINVVAHKDAGISSIADLKGKTVGVPGSLGSDPAVMLQRALTAAGISISADNMEVDMVVYSNSDLQGALENGLVDAFVSWDPYASIVAKETENPIIWSQATDEQTKNETCCLLMVSPTFAEEHPEEALKFCQAIAKACEFIAEHPEEAAQIQIDKGYVANDDVELNTELLKSYNFKATIEECKESYIACAEDLINLGIVETDETAEELMNRAFITIDGLEIK